MNESLSLGPIGQISLEVGDIERAVAWYSDVLGLPHLFTFGPLAFFDCGGTRLFLEGHDDFERREQSVIYFRVEDINAAHEALKARGVTFTEAPTLIHRHDSGLEEWMAFFADPDGNMLAIMSQVQPR